ncbi:MAG: hypothetical protein M3025_00020 [Actinomycetota bacterium]|nr:hypothetical protein [Actinomycetota bacterium]
MAAPQFVKARINQLADRHQGGSQFQRERTKIVAPSQIALIALIVVEDDQASSPQLFDGPANARGSNQLQPLSHSNGLAGMSTATTVPRLSII